MYESNALTVTETLIFDQIAEDKDDGTSCEPQGREKALISQSGKAYLTRNQLAILDAAASNEPPIVGDGAIISLMSGYRQNAIDNYVRFVGAAHIAGELAEGQGDSKAAAIMDSLTADLHEGSLSVLLLVVECGLFADWLGGTAVARLLDPNGAEAAQLESLSARERFDDLVDRLFI